MYIQHNIYTGYIRPSDDRLIDDIYNINIVRDYYPYRRKSRFSVPIDPHNARLYIVLMQYLYIRRNVI